MLVHRLTLVSFRLFRKNLGNLREFLGKCFSNTPHTPSKNFPKAYACISRHSVLEPFLAPGELSEWLGNQDVRRIQWKVCNRFPIVSNSAGAFMHSLNGREECSYSDEIVKRKNVLHYICNHCTGSIIRYITSLTQYLAYSTSLPQDTFDLHSGSLRWL